MSGFYRVDNGDFQHAPNFVKAPTYTLLIADKDTYTYPTEGGWMWFLTDDEAYTHFGVTPPVVDEDPLV